MFADEQFNSKFWIFWMKFKYRFSNENTNVTVFGYVFRSSGSLSELTWAVFDIVGMQADVVSGVEQFDQWATRHIVELRLFSVTVWPQQQKQQWLNKNMNSRNYLHFCVSILMTGTHYTDRMNSRYSHFQTCCWFQPITAWQVLKYGSECRRLIGQSALICGNGWLVANRKRKCNMYHSVVHYIGLI